jgi:hypothetical protein
MQPRRHRQRWPAQFHRPDPELFKNCWMAMRCSMLRLTNPVFLSFFAHKNLDLSEFENVILPLRKIIKEVNSLLG